MNKTAAPEEPFKSDLKPDRVFDLVIVKVMIDGTEYRFLWDTGAICLVSEQIQQRHKLKTVMSSNIRDSQGRVKKLKYVQIPELEIGGIKFKKVGSAVTDLNQSTLLACMRLDGIIGGNLMKSCTWEMDLHNNNLSLSNRPDTFQVDSAVFKVPFIVRNNGTPYVRLFQDTNKMGYLTFDTGYGGFLSTSKKKVKTDSMTTKSYPFYGFNSAGLYGSSMTKVEQRMLNISLDSLHYNEGFAKLYQSKKSLLGVDFMKNYRIVIDYRKRELALSPLHLEKNDTYYRTLIPRYHNNRLIAGSVFLGKQMDTISPDAPIAKFNGKDVRVITNQQYCNLVLNLKELPDTVPVVFDDSTTVQSIKLKVE